MLIDCKIDVLKIPKDKLFKGEKGVYLDLKVAEKQAPDQYGNTHSVYIQKSKEDAKIYIGSGKAIHFNNEVPEKNQVTESDDLPF